MQTAEEPSPSNGLSFSLVPRVQVTMFVLSLIGLVVSVSLGSMGFVGSSVAGICVCLLFAMVFGVLSYYRRGHLSVGEVLAYKRGKLFFEIPRDAAVCIKLRRPVWPLQRPTDYSLEVRIGERTFLLPFAEHWLHGEAAGAKARTLASALDLTIHDPRGAWFRQSKVFWVRWMGAGHEWKALLFSVCVGSILGIVAIAVF